VAGRLRRIGDVKLALPPKGQAAQVHWDLGGEAVAVVAPGLREVLAPHLLTALEIPENIGCCNPWRKDTDRGKTQGLSPVSSHNSATVDSRMNHDTCFQCFHFGPVARTHDTEKTYKEGRNQSAMFNSYISEIHWQTKCLTNTVQ
jgi:hypothetical protein